MLLYFLTPGFSRMKKLYILLLTLNVISLIASCRVIESRDISEVFGHLIHDAAETLFVWDIDNTIAELDSPAPHHVGTDMWFCCCIEDHIKNGKTKQEAIELVVPDYTKAQFTYDLRLLQPEFNKVFQHLKNKKIRTIALTARNLSLRDRTHTQLGNIGVDFKEDDYKEQLILNKEKGIEYYRGIIFSNGNDKGKVLTQFLQNKENAQYKKIVIVDDSHPNIHAIASAFGIKEEIDVVAIRYGYLDEKVQEYRNAWIGL